MRLIHCQDTCIKTSSYSVTLNIYYTWPTSTDTANYHLFVLNSANKQSGILTETNLQQKFATGPRQDVKHEKIMTTDITNTLQTDSLLYVDH